MLLRPTLPLPLLLLLLLLPLLLATAQQQPQQQPPLLPSDVPALHALDLAPLRALIRAHGSQREREEFGMFEAKVRTCVRS